MIFHRNIKIKGFTLVELMVVIAIIAIASLSITQIDFNRISDKQRLEIFTNQIVSKYETTRNNTLIGKSVGVNLDTPEARRIVLSESGLGSITTSYRLGGSWTPQPSQSTINLENPYQIRDLRCIQLNNTSENISTDLTITFAGSQLTLSGCSGNEFKVLEFTSSYKDLEKTVSINTLNGLVSIN